MVVASYRWRIEFSTSEITRLLCFAGHLMPLLELVPASECPLFPEALVIRRLQD
jgi:hypothetical protein